MIQGLDVGGCRILIFDSRQRHFIGNVSVTGRVGSDRPAFCLEPITLLQTAKLPSPRVLPHAFIALAGPNLAIIELL